MRILSSERSRTCACATRAATGPKSPTGQDGAATAPASVHNPTGLTDCPACGSSVGSACRAGSASSVGSSVRSRLLAWATLGCWSAAAMFHSAFERSAAQKGRAHGWRRSGQHPDDRPRTYFGLYGAPSTFPGRLRRLPSVISSLLLARGHFAARSHQPCDVSAGFVSSSA